MSEERDDTDHDSERDDERADARATPGECSDALSASQPRERVRRHMQRLLGSVAAVSMAASCDPPPIVCDPLPPPIRCADDPPSTYLIYVSVDARWDDAETARIRLTAGSGPSGSGVLSFQGDPVVRSGGTLLEKSHGATTLQAVCRVPASSERLALEVPMACDDRQIRPLYSFDVSSARTPGASIGYRVLEADAAARGAGLR